MDGACNGKHRFDRAADALAVVRRGRASHRRYICYLCQHCGGYHLSQPGGRLKRLEASRHKPDWLAQLED